MRANLTLRFSHSAVAAGKTLVEKVRAQPATRNDMSLKQSTRHFWEWLTNPTTKLLRHYEDAILSKVELPKGVFLEKSKVVGLHQLHFINKNAPIKTPTLLVHGHGASGVFFHRNFANLSQNIQNLYAIDHPDVGLSDVRKLKVGKTSAKVTLKKLEDGKRHFTIKQNVEKNRANVEVVEKFYIDAFEEWRVTNKLDKVNLVAHSFGAFMAFKYSLQYPHRVNKLILCSPAGVERSIFSLNNKETKGIISQDPASPFYYRYAYLPWLITTFGFYLAKSFGPLAVQVLSKYLSLRYSRGSDDDEQIKLLVRYTIHLFYQPNQSFRNLLVVLNNQILSLDPILDHIKELKVPVHIMYGQYDWMNSQAGYEAFKEVQSPARFKIIQDAGHNLFLDNHKEFENEVIDFLK
jgi:pimeloyl-ACP methyl ester carboxylesterase